MLCFYKTTWFFLMQYKNPWGYSNQDLVTLYRGATADNECPLIDNQDLPTCGKSRFGCWVCTMVEKDKSMEAMITNDDEKAWMTPLLEFRNTFGDKTKLVFDINEAVHHFKKQLVPGFLLLLLTKCFEDIPLIFPKCWKCHPLWIFKFSAGYFSIEFREAVLKFMLVKYPNPADRAQFWKRNQFKIRKFLRTICADFHLDLKQSAQPVLPVFLEIGAMMKLAIGPLEESAHFAETPPVTILDSLNQRKGILDSLQSCISHTFYRDELDALQYYQERISRKKTLGGKFDEKFFTHIQDAGDEFTQEIPGDEGEE